MFLVTGATGNVGSQVVRELVGRGAPVRAFVRDAERARALLGESVELAVGDFDDPGSVGVACRDVDTLFLSAGDGPRKVPQETGAIDAAVAAGVRRIVKLSTVGAAAGSPAPFFDAHGTIEDHLRRAGVRATVIRGCFYMTNVLGSAEQVVQAGKLFLPAEGARIAIVDPADVGAAAAVVVEQGGPDDETLTVTGPQAITFADIAAALADATGRDVEFVAVPDEAARAGMLAAGMPEWLADALVLAFVQLRAGAAADVTHTFEELTGRSPCSFADWARRHADAFRGAPATV
jgi:uncharacterized protein YbjT (DUF2867 family)